MIAVSDLSGSPMRVAAWSVVAALAASCGGAPGLAGTITVSGSGSAYPAIKIVTDAFIAADPGVEVTYTPSSTGRAGALLAVGGKVDVAALGQPLPGDLAGRGLATWPVATDAVVVAVHPSVALSAITSDQLRSIYSGAIQSWADLGVMGAPPLVVLDRPEDETGKIALRGVLGPTLVISSSALTMSKEADMVKAVESAPGAIGYFSLSHHVGSPDRTRVLSLDGITPSARSIHDGTYPVTRPILLAASRAVAERTPLRELLAFLSSRAATAALERGGYGPGR